MTHTTCLPVVIVHLEKSPIHFWVPLEEGQPPSGTQVVQKVQNNIDQFKILTRSPYSKAIQGLVGRQTTKDRLQRPNNLFVRTAKQPVPYRVPERGHMRPVADALPPAHGTQVRTMCAGSSDTHGECRTSFCSFWMRIRPLAKTFLANHCFTGLYQTTLGFPTDFRLQNQVNLSFERFGRLGLTKPITNHHNHLQSSQQPTKSSQCPYQSESRYHNWLVHSRCNRCYKCI